MLQKSSTHQPASAIDAACRPSEHVTKQIREQILPLAIFRISIFTRCCRAIHCSSQ